jgi:hypothetical protein
LAADHQPPRREPLPTGPYLSQHIAILARPLDQIEHAGIADRPD